MLYREKGGKLYKTSLENYIKAKTIKMAGRVQRFVNLLNFEESENFEPIPRPEDKIFINERGEDVQSA